jgi:hypothetical protein
VTFWSGPRLNSRASPNGGHACGLLRGLLWERCYECRGEYFYFRAGSYSQHADFRQELARAALNVDADDIYADPGPFRDKPFFELIFFADTQGCIGPLAAADLAADFAQGRVARSASQAGRGLPVTLRRLIACLHAREWRRSRALPLSNVSL